ncbi:SigE family RNA polymerase sigma factor [Lapillicoccus jejuensis]|uniref:RNA polymerase sigma-70 factor (Sigma-E family) n=1 Tax=Lapillicoccus jejuensis TaxID=402171 RepID=A0A542E083_9MICO|nr:SigE family RNA polymerase sigma factor [Lapillicoccus jejuensis]TQJ08743.1 RNA polymerase sigma-70 factor (sigma-E family) [Lapillicoccus jejuensis]
MTVGTAHTVREDVDVPAIYQTHWRPMVRLALLLVDDVAAAEDVVQDAFIALHRQQDRLRDPHAAIGYLRTTVVNMSRSAIRRRVVARKHLRVAEPEGLPGADENVVLREEHAEVLAALRTLPDRQREVLVLRYFSGVSENEIAAILGISTGTVKSSASRGLASLRTVMGGRA